ncbi:unnamed protein product [Boreogadus saida]
MCGFPPPPHLFSALPLDLNVHPPSPGIEALSIAPRHGVTSFLPKHSSIPHKPFSGLSPPPPPSSSLMGRGGGETALEKGKKETSKRNAALETSASTKHLHCTTN